jgi:hypothetical protein
LNYFSFSIVCSEPIRTASKKLATWEASERKDVNGRGKTITGLRVAAETSGTYYTILAFGLDRVRNTMKLQSGRPVSRKRIAAGTSRLRSSRSTTHSTVTFGRIHLDTVVFSTVLRVKFFKSVHKNI